MEARGAAGERGCLEEPNWGGGGESGPACHLRATPNTHFPHGTFAGAQAQELNEPGDPFDPRRSHTVLSTL